MALLQISDDTGFLRVVSWQEVTAALGPQQGLNMGSATMAANAVVASRQIQPMVPLSFMLVLQLTSGALTLATSVNAGTANFGSPTNSLSVSGTTVLCTPLLQTTLTSPFVNVQATAGGSGCVIARAMMLILGAFQKNAAGAVKAGYHESVFSINAFASNAYPGGGFDYLLSF